MPDPLPPEPDEEQEVLLESVREYAKPEKEEEEERRLEALDAEAVAQLATPAILELLEEPALASGVNEAVRAAVFKELMRREGMAFARKAMKKVKGATDLDAGPERSTAGGHISAAPPAREEHKDTAGPEPGGQRKEAVARETPAKAAAAAKEQGVKRRVVEEALAAERGGSVNGHVSYWVGDEAELVPGDNGFSLKLHKLDLHTRVHVRDPGDPGFSSIEEFGPYFGGPFDTGFAEFSGILLHEQQHVSELSGAWEALWPAFQAQVEGIRSGSPEEAEAAYREAFEEFDSELFRAYFSSGEVEARAREWAHYHQEYEKRVGKPEGAPGSAAKAESEGKAHGEKETVKAQAAAKMAAAQKGKPRKQVSGAAAKRLKQSEQAIQHAKTVFAHGAGNQREALKGTNFNSYFRLAAMRDPECWEMADSVKPLAAANPEALDAAKADLAQGGNCGEHASIAFDYLRVQAPGERIAKASKQGLDHAFVLMGDTDKEKDEELVVADAWPSQATAVLWEDFFAYTSDRTKIETDSEMTADGKDVKAAIAAGLKLTPKGLAMIEDSLSEEETDKEIKEGTKGDHPWIWRHRNTAGHGKEYDYHSE